MVQRHHRRWLLGLQHRACSHCILVPLAPAHAVGAFDVYLSTETRHNACLLMCRCRPAASTPLPRAQPSAQSSEWGASFPYLAALVSCLCHNAACACPACVLFHGRLCSHENKLLVVAVILVVLNQWSMSACSQLIFAACDVPFSRWALCKRRVAGNPRTALTSRQRQMLSQHLYAICMLSPARRARPLAATVGG